jgi:hypothetical protein
MGRSQGWRGVGDGAGKFSRGRDACSIKLRRLAQPAQIKLLWMLNIFLATVFLVLKTLIHNERIRHMQFAEFNAGAEEQIRAAVKGLSDGRVAEQLRHLVGKEGAVLLNWLDLAMAQGCWLFYVRQERKGRTWAEERDWERWVKHHLKGVMSVKTVYNRITLFKKLRNTPREKWPKSMTDCLAAQREPKGKPRESARRSRLSLRSSPRRDRRGKTRQR